MAQLDANVNYITFRECLSGPLIEASAVKPGKSSKRTKGCTRSTKVTKNGVKAPKAEEDGAEDLADFIDVYAMPQCCLIRTMKLIARSI